MSLFDHIARVREHLQQQGRVSFRAIRREFDVDDDGLEEIIEELVDIQQVAIREEKAIAWTGDPATPVSITPERAPPRPTPEPLGYTPKHLAEKILKSRAALEGERKQVSVLFVDIKSSMSLAAQLDAGVASHS